MFMLGHGGGNKEISNRSYANLEKRYRQISLSNNLNGGAFSIAIKTK